MNYHSNNYNTSIEDPSIVFQKILSPYFLNEQPTDQPTHNYSYSQPTFNKNVELQYLSKTEKTDFINKLDDIIKNPCYICYSRPGFVDQKINKNTSSFDTNPIKTISNKLPSAPKEYSNQTELYNYSKNNQNSCSSNFLKNSSVIKNKDLNINSSYINSSPPPYYSNTYNYSSIQTPNRSNYHNSSSYFSKPIKGNITNGKYQSYRPAFLEESSNNVYNKRSAFILSSKFHENTESNYNNYCNNCGKTGHGFYQCKNPITSYGIIVFRYIYKPETNTKERQYLMIRRRDTISYVDFLRGKYSLFNRKYIKRLINDMSESEQNQIMTHPFDYLWYELWKNNEPNPKDEFGKLFAGGNEGESGLHNTNSINTLNENIHGNEKFNVRDKFNILQKGLVVNGNTHFTIENIVKEIKMEQETLKTDSWKEPEWGFCKGRRNYKENDYDCAVREMQEETGYSKNDMTILKNVNTFEEVFIGSNLKSYRHKYYLMYMTYENSLKTGDFEKTEVSCIRWVSFNECLSLIRSYNVEKKRMITNIDNALNKYCLFN